MRDDVAMFWSAPSHYLNQCWNIVNSILRTSFGEISIEMNIFSFTNMLLKTLSAKCRQFSLGFNVLMVIIHKLHTCCEPINKPQIPTHVASSSDFTQGFRSNYQGMHAHINTMPELTPANLLNPFGKLSNNYWDMRGWRLCHNFVVSTILLQIIQIANSEKTFLTTGMIQKANDR